MRINSLFFVLMLAVLSTARAGQLDDRLFTVQRDGRESGSGFLMKDADGVWMVSNYHVVRGDEVVEFVDINNARRSYKLPDEIEVAQDRDAVRFKVNETDGFPIAADCSFDETVYAFGNSGGAGVITKSKGTVVGKGRGEVEVTCEIIPGNSGGPVINPGNEVIGVATFIIQSPAAEITSALAGTLSAFEREQLTKKMREIQGTRYEQTRRFAIPLSATEWQKVPLGKFQSESKTFEKTSSGTEAFREAVGMVLRARRVSSEAEEVLPPRWVRAYNKGLAEYGYSSTDEQFIIKPGSKDSFRRAFGRWLEDLSESALLLAERRSKEAEDFTVIYFKNKIREMTQQLGSEHSLLSDIAEKYKP